MFFTVGQDKDMIQKIIKVSAENPVCPSEIENKYIGRR